MTLIAGPKREDVSKTSVKLLNFLGDWGLRVSQKKMQFVGKEVKYLGHLISEGSKKLDPARISRILQIQLPKTKRELRKFLGLCGRRDGSGSVNPTMGEAVEAGGFSFQDLRSMAQGWPTCVQAVAATVIMVEESRKLTFGGSLVVSVPHQVKSILNQRAGRWLTDPRILKYEAILLERDDLILSHDTNQNPAAFLVGEPDVELKEGGHSCMELIDFQTRTREDLQESPIPDSVNLFIDGSSRVVEGKRRNGYAIIDGDKTAVVDLGELPNPWSAQTCELYALSRVLKLLKGREGNIYTDSKYAWGVIHVLKDLHLPKALAVVYVNGHQKRSSFKARGNCLADEEAKRAGELGQRMTDPILVLIPTFPSNLKPVSLSEKEAKGAQDLGAQKDEHGMWVLPDGRKVLNEATTRQVLQHLHQGSHWDVQNLCDAVLVKYICPGIYTLARQTVDGYIICRRTNKNTQRRRPSGGRPPGIRPFQSIQVDFTEVPPVGRLKYLLVVVDLLTSWVEAFPLAQATATAVSKALLEQIIPRYGLIQRIDSDQGTHSTARALQSLMKALEVFWDLYTPWHPPSSGRVERMNREIKKQHTRLMIETRLPWTKCIPLALLRIRTKPRRDIGLSLYELLYGRPYPARLSKDRFLKEYVQSLSSYLFSLQRKGIIAQTPPMGYPVHKFQPGDWILIRAWKEEKLMLIWEGPFQILLTADTAVRTKERGWTHTRVKGLVQQSLEWTIASCDPDRMKNTIRRGPGETDIPWE
ncbi:uncharacterized protein LOC119947880 [Tachyglossus aculeatus]|uniref:uncharacterized protein LOC119947880 n=1 Tax=Tachyglossus aculeatus TaxID=9261 RepID=UPI0018F3CA9A|nr:uncharacterized protein LOC119947880 [Tachyglossus aculeatus]